MGQAVDMVATLPFLKMAEIEAEDFGAWLKRHREQRGWTLIAMAEKASTTHVTISRLEKGDRNPSRNMAVRIARALGVDPMDALDALSRSTEGLEEMERVADSGREIVVHAYEGMPTEAAKKRMIEMVKLLQETERRASIGGTGEAEE